MKKASLLLLGLSIVLITSLSAFASSNEQKTTTPVKIELISSVNDLYVISINKIESINYFEQIPSEFFVNYSRPIYINDNISDVLSDRELQIVIEKANNLIGESTEIALNKEAIKWQRLWEPVGDDYTYYYKEYSVQPCPPGLPGCSADGTYKVATGNCKSTSGVVYSCNSGQ